MSRRGIAKKQPCLKVCRRLLFLLFIYFVLPSLSQINYKLIYVSISIEVRAYLTIM